MVIPADEWVRSDTSVCLLKTTPSSEAKTVFSTAGPY